LPSGLGYQIINAPGNAPRVDHSLLFSRGG
jgi:hypothetical protein